MYLSWSLIYFHVFEKRFHRSLRAGSNSDAPPCHPRRVRKMRSAPLFCLFSLLCRSDDGLQLGEEVRISFRSSEPPVPFGNRIFLARCTWRFERILAYSFIPSKLLCSFSTPDVTLTEQGLPCWRAAHRHDRHARQEQKANKVRFFSHPSFPTLAIGPVSSFRWRSRLRKQGARGKPLG